MCNYDPLSPLLGPTERNRLEAALNRADKMANALCDDSKTIVAARQEAPRHAAEATPKGEGSVLARCLGWRGARAIFATRSRRNGGPFFWGTETAGSSS